MQGEIQIGGSGGGVGGRLLRPGEFKVFRKKAEKRRKGKRERKNI